MLHSFPATAYASKRPAWQLRCAALFLAGMVFVLARFATSPQLHAWLHGSADPTAVGMLSGVASCGSDVTTESSESHTGVAFCAGNSFFRVGFVPTCEAATRSLPLLATYDAGISARIECAQARAPPIKS